MPLWWKGKKSEKNKAGSPPPLLSSRNSPRRSGEFIPTMAVVGGRGSGGFNGFEFDGLLAERRGHPLPLPVNMVVLVLDLNGVSESGSVSVSSLASSGSSDDQLELILPRLDSKERKLSSRVISPVPGSRNSTAATSPLHPRVSPGSGGRNEDGASQCHPLPLPPNSPTSTTLPDKRTRVVDESNLQFLFQWKKGEITWEREFWTCLCWIQR